MKLIELLSNPVFRIPLKKGKLPIIRTLSKELDIYLQLLQNLHNADKFTALIQDNLSDIERLCNKIKDAINDYLRGSPHSAYDTFSKGISYIESFLYFRIQERMKYPENMNLFRIRSSKSKYLSRSDMFHVPFELRGKIRNQRFSVSGFPCLYLGSSIYVCWEELNRPDFERLFISKFRLLTTRPQKLDLTFSVDEAQRSIEQFKEDDPYCEWRLFNTVEKIILFPLILSCSIIEKGSTNIFKEEYIIPQMLLEWIHRKGKINAIEYLSSALPEYKLSNTLYRNYVFPAKRQKTKGCCSFLSSIFELTEPISWTLGQSIYGHTNSTLYSAPDFNILNQACCYANTQFGNMERIIDSMDFRKLETI